MKNFAYILLVLSVLQLQFAHANDHNLLINDKGGLVHEPVFEGKFFIRQTGDKNPDTIILVHGLGTLAGKEWGPIEKILANNYHVIVIDLPGFGRSDKKNLLYSPKNYARFIKWLIDRYAHETVTLVGHSLGGAIALYTAASYPQSVQKLVLIDTAGILNRTILIKFMTRLKAKSFPETLLKPFYLGINKASNALFNALDSENRSSDIEKILTSTALRNDELGSKTNQVAALALINTDFSNLLDRVTMPTLIIWGEKDNVTPLRTGKMLSYRLENARLKIINGAGHVTITEEPKIVTAYIKKFLQSDNVRPEWQVPEKTDRVARCRKKKDLVFVGHYLSIDLHGCKRIQLINVVTSSLHIRGSSVLIKDSRLHGSGTTLTLIKSKVTIEGGNISGDVALKTIKSVVKLTGVRLRGNIALINRASRLDIAGSLLEGKEAAIQTTGRNTLQASVSQTKSPHGKKYLHGPVVLSSRQAL